MTAISILIRTIGRQAALKDALESLNRQTFKDFEVVVVEDGPDTLGYFLAAYTHLSIRYEALGTRHGRSIAGNRALALAQGEYCIFLDEDDAFYPEHLQALLQGIKDSGRQIAYSWSEERPVERDAGGTITRSGRFKRYRHERFSLLHLMASNFLPINAVLFARSLTQKAGGFDEDIDCLEDWLLWLRLAGIEPEWACVPRITAIYHVTLDKHARRRAFHIWHAQVKERMRSIPVATNAGALHFDMKRHFFVAIFLRKLYYYAIGFFRWS